MDSYDISNLIKSSNSSRPWHIQSLFLDIICCQTPDLGLRLGVDFVFPLSQEQQQEQQDQPPPKSKLEFDTKDKVLFSNPFIFQFFQG